jgi:hypothetical protein
VSAGSDVVRTHSRVLTWASTGAAKHVVLRALNRCESRGKTQPIGPSGRIFKNGRCYPRTIPLPHPTGYREWVTPQEGLGADRQIGEDNWLIEPNGREVCGPIHKPPWVRDLSETSYPAGFNSLTAKSVSPETQLSHSGFVMALPV